jgi:decaprenylphospho-beta-D-ribofuranose 2-oxidase
MERIFNWGIYPTIDAEVTTLSTIDKVAAYVKTTDAFIPRGNGRCYGDSALQPKIFSTLALNKFLSFDVVNGIIKTEAGVLLSEILDVVVPKGFFLPVTPGTKFITMGGAVASNIHGKNHHKDGAISQYIECFDLMVESGEILRCSRTENTTLFINAIGGMGLTGVVLTVTLRLKKIETSYIKQKAIKAKNIHAILDYFEQYQHYTYSVAWIDCLSKGDNLGRSILMLGEHATPSDLNAQQAKQPLQLHSSKQIDVPFMFPAFALNELSIKAFNFLYYNKQRQQEINNVVHYNPYFYPLDILTNWNRIYGKNGFTQYQFAIPFENGREGLIKILTKIADSGCGSFLAVLKTFGKGDEYSSALSFPIEGYTLALDFKVSPKVFALLDELDKIVLDYGGRLYLTKDARMTSATFHQSYGTAFSHSTKFQSLQSNRLTI